MKQIHIPILGTVALVLALAFQNCSFTNSVMFSSFSKTKLGGNGTTYDGKLTFVQLQPGFRCEEKLSPKSVLRRDKINGKAVWLLSVNETDKCESIVNRPVEDVVYQEGAGRIIHLGQEYLLDNIAPWAQAGLIGYVREFHVTSVPNPETPDAMPGDGSCADINNECSLRAAIDEMNSKPDLASIVTVDPGTYLLTQELSIAVPSASWIRGAGRKETILDAQNLNRAFKITSSTLLLTDLAIVNGNDTSFPSGSGGAIYSTWSTLILADCLFMGNYATNFGGAVSANRGNLYVRRCQFQANRLEEVIGIHQGNAILSSFNVEFFIEDSEIIEHIGNESTYGVVYSQSDSTVKISGSLLYDNQIPGPAIRVRDCVNQIIMENSTVALNVGYGLYISNLSPLAIGLVIANSTFYENKRNDVGLTASNLSVDLLDLPKTILITNSAFSKEKGGNCSPGLGSVLGLQSRNNIVAGATCGFSDPGSLTVPSLSLFDTPVLTGGWTRVLMPNLGSPLVDSGDNFSCLPRDQRGQKRPVDLLGRGALCDVGAVELVP